MRPLGFRVPLAVLWLVTATFLSPTATAEEGGVPASWPAPPYWLPATVGPDSTSDGAPAPGARTGVASPAAPGALPSGALPFFAIAPCRLVDTRGAGSPWVGDWGPPALVASTARSFAIPAGPCPGIPSSAAAYSLNFTVLGEPGVYQNAFLTAWPTGSAQPTVSTLNFSGGQLFINAAVVPAGTSGSIDVLTAAGAHLILDVNGYYAPLGAVTSLTTGATTLTGAVTLAPGSNVTVTPSGQTLTIASTPGTHTHSASDLTSGTLPDGRLSGTYTGAVALSNAANDFTADSVVVNGFLKLSATPDVRAGLYPFLGSFSGNLRLGELAAPSLTTGTNNTAVGTRALYSAGGADVNTAVGYYALNAATTATYNTAVGAGALAVNQDGTDNTAVGNGSLSSSTHGSYNTAVGTAALWDNDGGTKNTAVGWQALMFALGSENTVVGYGAVSTADGATGITAVGTNALRNNDTGTNNAALGWSALKANSTGTDNTAVGHSALVVSASGNAQTAVGSHALAASTGSNNAAFGSGALQFLAAGSDNTALGQGALLALTGGTGNVAVGKGAGLSLTSGSSNIYVGHAGAASESGTIRVGSTQTSAYLAGVFGATATSGTAVYVSSSGKLGTTLSSRRYKRDIADVGATADLLLRLRPVAFRYTEDRDPSGEQQYGLIAEEVAEVAPELVVAGADGQPETVKYNLVDALLLELVKRQEARIQELEAAVRALQEPRTGPAR